MATTLFGSSSTALVIGTETFIDVNEAGVFKLIVDATLMADGDVLQARVYRKPLTSGTPVVVAFMAWYGAQPSFDAVKESIPFENDLAESQGLRFSLTQTHGTGRAIPRKVTKTA